LLHPPPASYAANPTCSSRAGEHTRSVLPCSTHPAGEHAAGALPALGLCRLEVEFGRGRAPCA
jgi:hypothetical protein